MRTINLLQLGLETILVDGSEGRSLQREIQGRLVLRRGPHVENSAIEVSAGHLNGRRFALGKKKQRLAKNAI
jgi:hypothetical protein